MRSVGSNERAGCGLVITGWSRGMRRAGPSRWARRVLGGLIGLWPVVAGCGYELLFPPLAVVENVDLSRYVGKWYEIARYPNFFQQQCFGGTTAEYALREDGSIRVINVCREGALDGPESRIEGVATIADPSVPAKLTVSFFPPFGAPYWIIDLDPDYQWAVVGEPSRSTLWILSRTASLPDAVYQDILGRLPEKGYDPARLILTPQS